MYYSRCKKCKYRKFDRNRLDIICTKFKKVLPLIQINSWECDCVQLEECKRKNHEI